MNWSGPRHNRNMASPAPRSSVFAAKYAGYCANCRIHFAALTPITLRKSDRKPVHGYGCPLKERRG
jgi:hypothetical protein